MVRPWVEVSNSQRQQIKELNESTGNSMSGMIRETISSFVARKDDSMSIGASHLPKAAREDLRPVTAYLPRSEWDLLVRISQNTGRCKTELVREAVEEYLRESS